MELQSNKGGRMFAHDGYVYHFDRLSSDGTLEFWRCEQRSTCKARVHTRGNVVVSQLHEHTHDSDVARVLVKTAINDMKERARSPGASTSQVLHSALQPLPDCALGVMPTERALKKTIQNVRKREGNAPPVPSSLNELVIPSEFQVYHTSPDSFENFLLGDSGPADDRILIFGRARNIELLKLSSTWYVDATFSVAPPLFYQVFVVLVERYGGVHPVCYALLPNKTEETYTRLFIMIKSMDEGIQPASVHCDFELAVMNAIRTVFPQANIEGCFFHLMHNMKRKIASHGLTAQYNADPDFACRARMIVALAFVPPDNMEKAFDALAEHIPAALEPVMNWFEDNYLGRPRRDGRRQPPRFSMSVWNVYHRTLENRSRTNNYAEASHQRLQKELSVEHPSLWRFIDALRSSQKGRDLYYELLMGGHSAPERARKYKAADEQILKLVQEFNSDDIVGFLRGITYNLQKKN